MPGKILLIIFIVAIGKVAAMEPAKSNEYWGRETKRVEFPLLTARRAENIPAFISGEFKDVSISVHEIDLDSDGNPDFIVHHDGAYKTCFIKSDNTKKYCEQLGYGDGFHIYWFAQLDDSPMLELFSMLGDSDYSDYRLFTFDQETWQRTEVFKISPFIVARKEDKDHSGIYWGYPWAIRGLKIKTVSGVKKFRASLNFKKFEEMPMEDGIHPMIFFDGLPTQGESRGYFVFLEDENRYYSLPELKEEYSRISKQSE